MGKYRRRWRWMVILPNDGWEMAEEGREVLNTVPEESFHSVGREASRERGSSEMWLRQRTFIL